MINPPTCYHYPEDRSVSSNWSEPEDNVWPVNTAEQTWGPAPAATSCDSLPYLQQQVTARSCPRGLRRTADKPTGQQIRSAVF